MASLVLRNNDGIIISFKEIESLKGWKMEVEGTAQLSM